MQRINGGSHRLRVNGGSHHPRVNGEWHHSLSPLRIVFSLFEPDLGLRVQVAGSRSSGLPSFGAVSLLRRLPSFEARCFRLLQGRLRIAGSLSRGLPSSGAVSLPRGLPPFGAEHFRLLQGGGVIDSS